MNTNDVLRRAEVFLRSADLNAATRLVEGVLAKRPGEPAALHLMATIMEGAGRLDEADRLLRALLRASPDDRRALDDLIRISQARNDFGTLANALLARVSFTPDRWELWNDLGAAFERLGRGDDADVQYRRSAAVAPDRERPLLNSASLAVRRGAWQRAEAAASRVGAMTIGSDEAWLILAVASQSLGRSSRAARAYRRALALRPSIALAWQGISINSLHALTEEQRTSCLSRSLHLAPYNPEVLANLAEIHRRAEKWESARVLARRAIALIPSSVTSINTLSLVHSDMALDQTALSLARRAADLAPQSAEVLVNLGVAEKSMGNFTAAEKAIRRALLLQPTHAAAHVSLATTLLVQGRVLEGLKEFEWRHVGSSDPARLSVPLWDGRPLRGGRLLVRGEQGLGDEIMFSQFIPLVQHRAPKIVLECDPRLVVLLRRSFPTVEVIARSPIPTVLEARGIGAQIPLCSVPYVLGLDEMTIESKGPFLIPNKARAKRAGEALRGLGNKPRIGIAWRSLRDTPTQARVHTHLTEWRPILRVPDVHFVNLQYGDREREIAGAESDCGISIFRPQVDLFNDLEGILALSSQLDLVIATTTTAYTLAAASGVETWLLMASFDYRSFGMRRDPLSPNCRGFIREMSDAWNTPIEAIASELRRYAEAYRRV